MEYNANGLRTRKGDTYYELDGSTVISETTCGDTIRYYYGNGGIVGFRYNGQRYYYEKNLMGDIVGIYDTNGNKVGGYTYDAWGNTVITTNVNNVANVNPFRYRGYYYDSDLGLYYLKSRYYDAAVGRFINADSIVAGVGGNVRGCNLFTYCFNNPICMYDTVGQWPKWLESVGEFFYNIGSAFMTSFEAQIGVGIGIGGSLSDNITAEIARDTYVGIDDGEWITGNIITLELSLFDFLGIGDSYDHLVEKGLVRISNSASVYDGPFDMINYPDVSRGSQFSFGFVEISDDGDFLISIGASAHVGGGGHAAIAFNVTEFIERIFD